MAEDSRGLLDTSVFIAQESGHPVSLLPSWAAISVITIAELQLGVLMANDPAIRAVRLRTLSSVEALFEPLPVDTEVARVFAQLVAAARREGRRPGIMDTWIAATAVANGLSVYTQDEGFARIPGVSVVRV